MCNLIVLGDVIVCQLFFCEIDAWADFTTVAESVNKQANHKDYVQYQTPGSDQRQNNIHTFSFLPLFLLPFYHISINALFKFPLCILVFVFTLGFVTNLSDFRDEAY